MSGCPPASVLEAHALDRLSDVAVAAHLAACVVCRAAVTEIVANEKFLKAAAPHLASASRDTAADPDVVPGYELIEEIGRGGQGVVYRAVQTATKRPAAVKMMLSGALATARQRARFEREIELAARLRHPCVVGVFESGSAVGGRLYVALEYVRGRSIDEHARRLPEERGSRGWIKVVARLMADVADGVGHAHAHGVIHRDLKPSNVLVDERGCPRVLDFGLATESGASAVGGVFTQEFAGTPAYAAPEQVRGGGIGPRTDVYALGLTLYVTLTGRHPYPIDGPWSEVTGHIADTPPAPPSRVLPRMSRDLETIILKSLSKEPERRYTDANALASDLRCYLAGGAIEARRDSAWYVLARLAAAHKVAAAATAVIATTVVLALMGLAFLARGLDHQRRVAEAALTDRSIERARLLGAAGELDRSEELLWTERLRPAGTPLLADSSALDRRLDWALMEYYSRAPRVMRERMDGAVLGVRFSDDGCEVEAVSRIGERKRWPVHHASLSRADPRLNTLEEPWCHVEAPDDGQYRVVSVENRPSLAGPWNLESGRRALAVSPGASMTLLAEPDGTLHVLDRSRTPVRRITGIEGTPICAEFSANGRYLALVTHVPVRVLRWDTATWEAPVAYTAPELLGAGSDRANSAAHLRSPAVSNDGHLVAAAFGGSLYLWRTSEPDRPRCSVMHEASIGPIRFDSGSDWLVSASTDGDLIAWRPEEFAPAARWRNGHEVGPIDIRADLGLIAAGSIAGTVSVYELPTPAFAQRLEIEARGLMAMSVSRDGGVLAHGGVGGRVTVRNTSTWRPIREIEAHQDLTTCVAFGHDGRWLVSVGMDGSVHRWGLAADEPDYVMAQGMPGFWAVACSPRGRYISAGGLAKDGRDGEAVLRLWDTAAGTDVTLTGGPRTRLPSMVFSPDDSLLLTAEAARGPAMERTAYVWECASGLVRHRLGGHRGPIRAVSFNRDGSAAATGSDDRTIKIWDPRNGRLLRTISGVPWDIFDIAFSATGEVLYCIGRGASVLVYDVQTGDELARLTQHVRSTFRMALLSDGERLFTGGDDPWIVRWDLRSLRRYMKGHEQMWKSALMHGTP